MGVEGIKEDLLNYDDKSINYALTMNERVAVYTLHDKQIHSYITSFDISADKSDICTTCSMHMPYKHELMEYWIPGTTTFSIVGGTFDQEILFIGRVREVNQRGEEIEVVGENVGWKFKKFASQDFIENKVKDKTVSSIAYNIFKELEFKTFALYLKGIPDIKKYKMDENCSVTYEDETVDQIPDLKAVVDRLNNTNIDYNTAIGLVTDTTQEAADKYNKQQMVQLSSVINSKNSYYSSINRKNTSLKNNKSVVDTVIDLPNSNMVNSTDKTTGDSEHTYEDIMKNIASAIDAHFYITDITPRLISFAGMMTQNRKVTGQKTSSPPVIEFWMQEDGTYNMDVNQYGFYNTVIFNYKDGQLKVFYDDLVRVFSEVPIEYTDKSLSYYGALAKAQSYLIAHIRDFNLKIEVNSLHTGKFVPGTLIKVKNPMTMSDGLYFLQGMSVNWSANGETLKSTLDIRYGPENPDDPEVPEVGAEYTSTAAALDTSGVTGMSDEVAQLAKQLTQGCKTIEEKARALYSWVQPNIKYDGYNNTRHGATNTLNRRAGNCCDQTHLFIGMARSVGVDAKYVAVAGHIYSVILLDNGQPFIVDPVSIYGWGGVAKGFAVSYNGRDILGF